MVDDSCKRSKRDKTWTRSKRSCRFCSSRKQRCELPQTLDNFDSVFTQCLDSESKLPDKLRCSRCQKSRRDCIPAVPGYGRHASRQTTRQVGTPPGRGAQIQSPRQSMSASPSTLNSESDPTCLPQPSVPPEIVRSIPNTSLSGLMRDIPSENVSSALFPHCSGVFPKELRLSPLAILPCLIKDVASRQRELQEYLAQRPAPCCDKSASLHQFVDHDALQLTFDCFPGLGVELFASIKTEYPILHDSLRNAVAFVATGRRQFLKGLSEGAMMTILASPACEVASLALVFYATYVPLEVAPIMPPAQDMNFTGFTDTVNANGLLRIADICAKRANIKRPSAIYLRLLNSELTRSFLLGQRRAECATRLDEAKKDVAALQTTDETRIAIAVCRCRLAMLETAFETQDYVDDTFAAHEHDLARWDLPVPVPLNFTDAMQTRSRAALAVFSQETGINGTSNRHPLWSSLNALAARLELVLLLKTHNLTIDPLTAAYTASSSSSSSTRTYTAASTRSWKFITSGLPARSTTPKFASLSRVRDQTLATARRLLAHANAAFDTLYPTVVASREMLTAVALASKQVLEHHVGMLALKLHDEAEMRGDVLLLERTAAEVGRAQTILAGALAGTVEAMAGALRAWLGKLGRMGGEALGMGGVQGAPMAAAVYDPARQTTTLQMQIQAQQQQQQQQQYNGTTILTPPADLAVGDAELPVMDMDWDNVLSELLGADMDWNWISF